MQYFSKRIIQIKAGLTIFGSTRKLKKIGLLPRNKEEQKCPLDTESKSYILKMIFGRNFNRNYYQNSISKIRTE
ncbi:hypothetical protein GWI33_004632 [Rhynchophorus ferrugineus]|uniref:Uncharacterized protein n=1 Tax=Rhynchophorus ferrugineus TaxID=354439 RepID=A0A834IT37_RHYFE|nr:hypothetical protein GWI33_004632 [Rhynchophorus ferrugineus]